MLDFVWRDCSMGSKINYRPITLKSYKTNWILKKRTWTLEKGRFSLTLVTHPFLSLCINEPIHLKTYLRLLFHVKQDNNFRLLSVHRKLKWPGIWKLMPYCTHDDRWINRWIADSSLSLTIPPNHLHVPCICIISFLYPLQTARLFAFFFIFFYFLSFWVHIWLWNQEPLLMGSGNYMGWQESNPGGLHASQPPYLLSYYSSPVSHLLNMPPSFMLAVLLFCFYLFFWLTHEPGSLRGHIGH